MLRAYLDSLAYAALATVLACRSAIRWPMPSSARRPAGGECCCCWSILPFWTSFLIRVYAWIGLLQGNGLVNNGCCIAVGLIHAPLPLLNNCFSVEVGLVYSYLPFMVLPLYAALSRSSTRR